MLKQVILNYIIAVEEKEEKKKERFYDIQTQYAKAFYHLLQISRPEDEAYLILKEVLSIISETQHIQKRAHMETWISDFNHLPIPDVVKHIL